MAWTKTAHGVSPADAEHVRSAGWRLHARWPGLPLLGSWFDQLVHPDAAHAIADATALISTRPRSSWGLLWPRPTRG